MISSNLIKELLKDNPLLTSTSGGSFEFHRNEYNDAIASDRSFLASQGFTLNEIEEAGFVYDNRLGTPKSDSLDVNDFLADRLAFAENQETINNDVFASKPIFGLPAFDLVSIGNPNPLSLTNGTLDLTGISGNLNQGEVLTQIGQIPQDDFFSFDNLFNRTGFFDKNIFGLPVGESPTDGLFDGLNKTLDKVAPLVLAFVAVMALKQLKD